MEENLYTDLTDSEKRCVLTLLTGNACDKLPAGFLNNLRELPPMPNVAFGEIVIAYCQHVIKKTEGYLQNYTAYHDHEF